MSSRRRASHPSSLSLPELPFNGSSSFYGFKTESMDLQMLHPSRKISPGSLPMLILSTRELLSLAFKLKKEFQENLLIQTSN